MSTLFRDKQYQRKANAFEKLMTTLQLPNNIMAGGLSALSRGDNPVTGAEFYIKEHKTFQDLLSEHGAEGLGAAAGGLILDVVTDPTNYVGFGELTAAGKAARALKVGSEFKGIATTVLDAAEAETGIAKFGETMAEQASRQQRALVTFAGQPVVYGEKVYKAADKIASVAGNNPVAKSLGKMFLTMPGVPEAVKLKNRIRGVNVAKQTAELEKELTGVGVGYYTELKNLGVSPVLAKSILRDSIELGSKYIDTSDLTGEATDAVHAAIANKTYQAISEVLTRYGKEADIDKLHPAVRDAVNYINASNAAYLANEQATGITVTQLLSDRNYLRHALTPEAMDIIMAGKDRGGFANSYDITVRFGAQLQRDEKLRNLTITEINDLAQNGKLHILGNQKVKLFEDEPFHATFIRGSESIKAIESAKMVQDSLKTYGKEFIGTINQPVHRGSLPEGFTFLSDRLAEDLGIREMEKGVVIKDIAVPTDIANVLEHHYSRVIAPQYLQPFLRGYDTLQRIWKNTLLPIWPAYHSRNALSDFFLITHGADDYGLGIPDALHAIHESLLGITGKAPDIKIGEDILSWDDYKALMDKYGIIDYSPGRDLDEGISRGFGLPRDKTQLQKVEEVFSKNRAIDFGLRMGMARQNATNSGYFLGLLRKGISPEIAAIEVKKRLFDFQDLTDFERQVMRRIFPFYAWLRHNLPYQIKSMATQPRILGQIQKTREAMSGGEGPAGETPLPAFLSGGLPMAWGGSEDKPQFVRLQGLVPPGDLALLDSPRELLVNQISPTIKAPAEMLGNYSSFRNEKLERFPWETTKRVGIDVPKRWTPVIDMVRPITEANNLLRSNTSASSKISGFTLSKAYPIDTKLQNELMNYKLKQAEVDAKKMMYKAAAAGDTGNVIRIRQWLNSLYENPAQLLK